VSAERTPRDKQAGNNFKDNTTLPALLKLFLRPAETGATMAGEASDNLKRRGW
jgi:hypothetical protein